MSLLSLQVDTPTRTMAVLLCFGLAAVAVALGLVTVFVANLFPDRPIFLLGLPLIIVVGIALVLSPRWLLMAMVMLRAILDPLFVQATLPGIGGLGGVLNVFIVLLALILFVRAKKVSRESWTPWVPFLAIMTFAVLRAPDKVLAVRSWLSIVTCVAVYHGAFYCARDAESLNRILKWLLLSALPVAIAALLSYALYGPSYVVEAGDAQSTRLSSPLVHPNILAFYFVVIVAAWLAKMKSQPGRPSLTWPAVGWLLYLVLALGILAGTQTRSAWFGALFLFLAYGVFINRTYLVLIVIGVLLSLTVADVRDRVLDLMSNNEIYTYSKLNSYAWRVYLWTSALAHMSPLNYVIGGGQGAFLMDSINFFPLAGGSHWNAHNVYIQLLFDSGLIGVASYLAVFFAIFTVLWRRKSDRPEVRVVGLALLAGFAFMSYSDNMLDYLVVNWNLWFLLGLFVAAGAKAEAPASVTAKARR